MTGEYYYTDNTPDDEEEEKEFAVFREYNYYDIHGGGGSIRLSKPVAGRRGRTKKDGKWGGSGGGGGGGGGGAVQSMGGKIALSSPASPTLRANQDTGLIGGSCFVVCYNVLK